MRNGRRERKEDRLKVERWKEGKGERTRRGKKRRGEENKGKGGKRQKKGVRGWGTWEREMKGRKMREKRREVRSKRGMEKIDLT